MAVPRIARYQPGAVSFDRGRVRSLCATTVDTRYPLLPQPDDGIVGTPLLALEPPAPPEAPFCWLIQVVNPGVPTTCAYWRIVEWPSPHSSAQTTSYFPSRDGVSRMCVVIPGTASVLSRNDGTQKEWRTSRVTTSNLTGRSLG